MPDCNCLSCVPSNVLVVVKVGDHERHYVHIPRDRIGDLAPKIKEIYACYRAKGGAGELVSSITLHGYDRILFAQILADQ